MNVTIETASNSPLANVSYNPAQSGSPKGLRWLKDPLSPSASRAYVPGAWPQVGGSAHYEPSNRWDNPAFRQQFKPHIRVTLAVLGCPGLYGLARELHMPLWKISTTLDDTTNLHKRLRYLNDDAYGSSWKLGDTLQRDDGFDDWVIAPTPEITGLSPHSPVQPTKRTLHVLLPATLSPRAFDNALKAKLAETRLDRWIQTEPALRHAAAIGIPTERLKRFTAYDVGSDTPRMSAAEEIIIFKPAKQMARLVGVVEGIIAANLP
ncbi:MAG: hypothetical protein ACRCWF_19050 [Beijerinckiaceae bacterium]